MERHQDLADKLLAVGVALLETRRLLAVQLFGLQVAIVHSSSLEGVLAVGYKTPELVGGLDGEHQLDAQYR